jgi:hypothetical protein
MATRISGPVQGAWRVGEREFLVFPSEPDPFDRLAEELGLPRGTSRATIEQALSTKTWDKDAQQWVDD